jgi:hypothetical protein
VVRAALLVLATGCALGAPPGFSSGDTWTFPLVDPLADGRLLVPVMVHGQGPYLFIVDRDSPTIVDPQVVAEAGVRMRGQIRIADHSDTTHVAFAAELTDVKVGDLAISLVHVVVLPHPNRFDTDGRRIHGILGREVLADSLVFGFDRDRGIAWLKTQQAFSPPPGATALELEKFTRDGVKVVWEPVLRASVNGVAFDLHPRIGELVGQIPRTRWSGAKLSELAWDVGMLDHSGESWRASSIGVADQVTIGGVAGSRAAFAPYSDRRREFDHVGGTIGLDFFRPFAVAADWHHRVIYVTQRQDPLASRALRIARWQALASCANGECVELALSPPRDNDPARPVLAVRNEDVSHDLQVTVRATTPSGGPLPNLEINLPQGTHSLDTVLDARYLDAKLEVLDLSPFPRRCVYVGGCVMVQAPAPP